MPKITFDNKTNPFFKVLKEKVEIYFTENPSGTFGSLKLYFKSIIQVSTAIALYIILVFYTPDTALSLILCGLLGFNFALIGFNIMHEGGHQSFSKHKWVNKVAAYFLNVLGGNTYFWKMKHNINHHTYTNIEGMDSDIDVKPFMRLHEDQPKHKFHRFQHLYWVILYGVSYLAWIFYHDFQKYFSGEITAGSGNQKINLREHVIFWVTKLAYIGVYIVLPTFMVGLVETLIGFVVISFVCGLLISVVFQLAHVVEGTVFFETPSEQFSKIQNEWALHQIKTTANFATENKAVSWLLGGLNFQIEHHLFPKISHIHYPKISQFVKETCVQFNITYIEYPSVFKAFLSHFSYIKRLGTA